jgi:hypothetical protein
MNARYEARALRSQVTLVGGRSEACWLLQSLCHSNLVGSLASFLQYQICTNVHVQGVCVSLDFIQRPLVNCRGTPLRGPPSLTLFTDSKLVGKKLQAFRAFTIVKQFRRARQEMQAFSAKAFPAGLA